MLLSESLAWLRHALARMGAVPATARGEEGGVGEGRGEGR